MTQMYINIKCYRIEESSEEENDEVDESPEEVSDGTQTEWPRLEDPTVWRYVDHGEKSINLIVRLGMKIIYFFSSLLITKWNAVVKPELTTTCL